MNLDRRVELMLKESKPTFKSKLLKKNFKEISREKMLITYIKITNKKRMLGKTWYVNARNKKCMSKSLKLNKREEKSGSRKQSERKKWRWKQISKKVELDYKTE